MQEFVDIKKEDIKEVILNFKERLKAKNLDKVAKYLEVSRPMLFNYLSKRYLLPKVIFDKIIPKHKKLGIKYKIITREKFIQHKPKIPKLDEDLAEIIGALNGDGHIANNLCDISITGHRDLDSLYLDHLSGNIKKLFNISFKKTIYPHFSRIRGHSKQISLFFVNQFGLPIGNKKGKLNIPSQVKNSDKLIFAYLRGLFDTDGTFYLRRKNEPVIEFSSADLNFLKQVQKELCLRGFKAGIGEHRVFIYNKQDIYRFFRVVKPANNKHLKKFNLYNKLCAGGLMAESLASNERIRVQFPARAFSSSL